MKRSDLELIQRYLANTRPDMRADPVIMHDTWRRIVTGLGMAFEGSPWAHLHDPDAWLHGTGAEVREPAPREGEPYERDGAWYNLTESEGLERGLVPDPSAPRWLVPRNLDASGNVIVDAENGQIMDAVSGEWRDMTDAERAQYPAPAPVDPADYQDARESLTRSDYCRERDPGHAYACTRPRGHAGLHAAMSNGGVFFRTPWATPARVAAQPAFRRCGEDYTDEDDVTHTCTERRGHEGSHYDSDSEVEWD